MGLTAVRSPMGGERLRWVLQLRKGNIEVRHKETSKEEHNGVVLT
jgi:hypothetical protein